MKLNIILFALLFGHMQVCCGQHNTLEILNGSIEELLGDQQAIAAPFSTFESLEEACNSPYLTCDSLHKEIESIDFSELGLKGILGEKTSLLAHQPRLKVVNLGLNCIDASNLFELQKSMANRSSVQFLTYPQFTPEEFMTNKYLMALIDGSQAEGFEAYPEPIKENATRIFEAQRTALRSNKDASNAQSALQDEQRNDDTSTYKIVEAMPRFPGCENIDTLQTNHEKESCAKMKMLEYIYSNLKYPNVARENAVEGMVVLQFTIDKFGRAIDINVVREIGAGCGVAALNVIKKMNHDHQFWLPGISSQRYVKVLYTLPVRFKLEG